MSHIILLRSIPGVDFDRHGVTIAGAGLAADDPVADGLPVVTPMCRRQGAAAMRTAGQEEAGGGSGSVEAKETRPDGGGRHGGQAAKRSMQGYAVAFFGPTRGSIYSYWLCIRGRHVRSQNRSCVSHHLMILHLSRSACIYLILRLTLSHRQAPTPHVPRVAC